MQDEDLIAVQPLIRIGSILPAGVQQAIDWLISGTRAGPTPVLAIVLDAYISSNGVFLNAEIKAWIDNPKGGAPRLVTVEYLSRKAPMEYSSLLLYVLVNVTHHTKPIQDMTQDVVRNSSPWVADSPLRLICFKTAVVLQYGNVEGWIRRSLNPGLMDMTSPAIRARLCSLLVSASESHHENLERTRAILDGWTPIARVGEASFGERGEMFRLSLPDFSDVQVAA